MNEVQVGPDTSPPDHRASQVETLARLVLEFGKLRDAHFDPEVSTDGPFTLLLTLFRHRDQFEGVPIDVVLESVDIRLSTAVYVVERLVDWLHVERVGSPGDERYRLTPRAERSMEGYLQDCLRTMQEVQHRR